MIQKNRSFYYLLFCLPLFNSCTGFLNKETANSCSPSQKVSGITADDVYDLSGYSANGGSSPFRLFDENDLFDPKNGITGTPATSPQPTRQADIYFPLKKGNRIVVDLRVPY